MRGTARGAAGAAGPAAAGGGGDRSSHDPQSAVGHRQRLASAVRQHLASRGSPGAPRLCLVNHHGSEGVRAGLPAAAGCGRYTGRPGESGGRSLVLKKLRSIQRSVDRHGWETASRCGRCSVPNLGDVRVPPPARLCGAHGVRADDRAARRGGASAPRLRDGHDRLRGRGRAPRLSGGGGRIGEGVQWMTAASGIVHEEFHGREYARRGGPFEMVQLGSTCREGQKAPPGYQAIEDRRSRRPAPDGPGRRGSSRGSGGVKGRPHFRRCRWSTCG